MDGMRRLSEVKTKDRYACCFKCKEVFIKVDMSTIKVWKLPPIPQSQLTHRP